MAHLARGFAQRIERLADLALKRGDRSFDRLLAGFRLRAAAALLLLDPRLLDRVLPEGGKRAPERADLVRRPLSDTSAETSPAATFSIALRIACRGEMTRNRIVSMLPTATPSAAARKTSCSAILPSAALRSTAARSLAPSIAATAAFST
ncbi:MAG TPA: hypothetical protein VLX85_02380 [Stellaceae bacterium]|nr:hypothetical protein [Stellaceae bacterium]